MENDIDFGANVCFSDAVYKPIIRRQLAALLKQSPPDDSQFQTFLDENGYATTPAAVRAAFSALETERPKISPRGIRFAADFLHNPPLRRDWIKAAQSMASAPPSSSAAITPAGQPDPALAPLQTVLNNYGYSDLSPEQAAVAQTNLLDEARNAWIGVYETHVTPRSDGASTQHHSPTLTITATPTDPSRINVKLGAFNLIGAAFDEDGLTLRWVEDPDGDMGKNITTGNLVFSSRADGSKVFAGALTYISRGRAPEDWDPGVYDYTGATAAPQTSGGPSGPDANLIIGAVFGGAGLVVGVLSLYVAYRAWRATPPANPADPPAADPLADPAANPRIAQAAQVDPDVVEVLARPIPPEVMQQVAPPRVIEMANAVLAAPNLPGQVSLPAPARAVAQDIEDEYEDDFEPESEVEAAPVEPPVPA